MKEKSLIARLLTLFPFLGYLPPHEFKNFMIPFDIFVISWSYLFVIFVRYGKSAPQSSYVWFLPLFIIILGTLLYFFKMYDLIPAKQPYKKILLTIIKTILLGYIFWKGFMAILNVQYVTVRFEVVAFIFTGITMTVEKFTLIFLFRYQHKRGINFRKILIVGSGKRAQRFIDVVNQCAWWGVKIVGLVDDEEKVGSMVNGNRVIGSLNKFSQIIEENVVDEVVFVLPRMHLSSIEDYILLCEKVGIKVLIAADFFTPSIARLKTIEFYDMPFLRIDTTSYNIWHLFIKRLFDFFISVLMIIINVPVFVICAIAIKLTSPGPILFRQKRLGLNKRIFTLYKFRTMVEDADKMLGKVMHLTESKGPVFHSRKDPRLTPIGRILRMTSLDELPQFFNVLKGDMSIIGPRPPLPEETDKYEMWQRRRLSLRPGIVCTWQVTKRFQPDFDEWVKMDLEYIDNWSLMLDFKIFLKILPAILKGFHYWLVKKE
jgi:exopolysaccharide biosynthesis polyprenyl glycosylphosphotransferase